MKRYFFTGRVFLPGIIVAQIIATIQVYLSNRAHFHSIEMLKSAGFLIIPNPLTMHRLLEFSTAFYGGLFFTLTIGAALSLIAFCSAWIWVRIFLRKKIILLFYLIFWSLLIIEINSKGFYPVKTSYFLFIPLIVFFAARRYMPEQSIKTGRLVKAGYIIPALGLAFFWILQVNSGLFINIRDYLLLSNSPGIRINDFYYRYTLYPALVIKSLEQRTLKTCRFTNIDDSSLQDRLKKELTDYDYLEVNETGPVDLTLEIKDNELILYNKGEIVLDTSVKEFLAKPGYILNEFSSRIDSNGFFRSFIFFSLLTGFPAVLIILYYTLTGIILSAFLDCRRAAIVSVFLCLITGIIISVIYNYNADRKVNENNLSESLNSAHWQDRVTALKIIDRKKLNIVSYGEYKKFLSSPHIPVRYWLAKSLGQNRNPGTCKDLLKLLDDPCPNVVCMAYQSLGKRGEKGSIREILKRIKISGHYYEQWYAYRALRSLGWNQAELK